MENHHFYRENWPFSMAMSHSYVTNFQRVCKMCTLILILDLESSRLSQYRSCPQVSFKRPLHFAPGYGTSWCLSRCHCRRGRSWLQKHRDVGPDCVAIDSRMSWSREPRVLLVLKDEAKKKHETKTGSCASERFGRSRTSPSFTLLEGAVRMCRAG